MRPWTMSGKLWRAHAPMEDEVEPTEIQARATIAAALITSRAVELPTMPTHNDRPHEAAARRLRDLTDYVYEIIVTPRTR